MRWAISAILQLSAAVCFLCGFGGVIWTLLGGPPWALLAGFMGPPLTVAFVAIDDKLRRL